MAVEQKSDRKSFSLRKVGLWKTYFKRSKPKTVRKAEKTALEGNLTRFWCHKKPR